jgi:hypothetical protein
MLGLAPVPESATFCGLLLALSPMLSVAARLPAAVGAKLTVTWQLDPLATELPQLLV